MDGCRHPTMEGEQPKAVLWRLHWWSDYLIADAAWPSHAYDSTSHGPTIVQFALVQNVKVEVPIGTQWSQIAYSPIHSSCYKVALNKLCWSMRGDLQTASSTSVFSHLYRSAAIMMYSWKVWGRDSISPTKSTWLLHLSDWLKRGTLLGSLNLPNHQLLLHMTEYCFPQWAILLV